MSSLIAQQCGNPWNSCIQGSVFQPWLRVQRALLHTTEVGGKIQTLHDDQPIRVLLRGIQDDPRYHADGARFPQLNSSKSTALFTQFAQFSPSLLQVPDLNGSLSGRWFQLLWKIWKSVWIIIPNIGKVIKFMFQTTNQTSYSSYRQSYELLAIHMGWIPTSPSTTPLYGWILVGHLSSIEFSLW